MYACARAFLGTSKLPRFVASVAAPPSPCHEVMAPHMTPKELDAIKSWSGKGLTPTEIHAKLKAQRAKRGRAAPHLTKVRLALRGKTYKRGFVETRGRPR